MLLLRFEEDVSRWFSFDSILDVRGSCFVQSVTKAYLSPLLKNYAFERKVQKCVRKIQKPLVRGNSLSVMDTEY